ncbi:hypothetical protein R2F61_08105 [Mollicutes bacterium LVI A0078]|nr:hypothetical protein RZE84_07880 [Mollicutes bacterium LVI A0075]WOO90676.1 hypothetical protein R2F61_08105 [Mollicutes bacterium LVI A0078]
MSIIAIILFANPTPSALIATWMQKYAINLPFVLGWQIIFCGPFVRSILKLIRKQTDSQLQTA